MRHVGAQYYKAHELWYKAARMHKKVAESDEWPLDLGQRIQHLSNGLLCAQSAGQSARSRCVSARGGARQSLTLQRWQGCGGAERHSGPHIRDPRASRGSLPPHVARSGPRPEWAALL